MNFKLAESLRREISLIVRSLKKSSLQSLNLSVSRVEIKEKSLLAKVYVSSIKGFMDAKKSIKPLNQAKGFIKRQISNALKLKKCPDLEFVADDFVSEEEKIEKILAEIKN